MILTEGSRYFVQNQKCQKQLFAMDTYMEFTAYGKNSEKAVDAAIEEVQKLDAMLSAENSKSEVYALNEQGNLQATDDLAELILRGKEIYQVDKKSTLCDLAKEMKVYPQVLRNVRVADKKTARENPKVVEAVEAAGKALGDSGRILVRESGTEPLIRVMVEAETDELCHQYVDSVVEVMEAEGLIVG